MITITTINTTDDGYVYGHDDNFHLDDDGNDYDHDNDDGVDHDDDGDWMHGKQHRAAFRLDFWMRRSTDVKMVAKQAKIRPGESRGHFRCMWGS